MTPGPIPGPLSPDGRRAIVPAMGAMVQRILRILLHPKDEWVQTIAEPGDARGLLVPYVVALAAILPIAQFMATAVVGESVAFLGRVSSYRTPPLASALMAALLLAALVGVWIVFALVINLLAPSFQARQDPEAAWKLATYSLTPVWLAGALAIFSTLHGATYALYFIGLVGGVGYAWYLLFAGLPIVLGTPDDKALAHSIVAVLATAIAAGVGISVLYAVFGTLLLGSVLPSG